MVGLPLFSSGRMLSPVRSVPGGGRVVFVIRVWLSVGGSSVLSAGVGHGAGVWQRESCKQRGHHVTLCWWHCEAGKGM